MACCKDCTERVLGCHSTCERYINECEERERLKQMQKGYQLKDCEISDFVELGFGYRSEYVYNLIQLANSNIDLKSFFYNRDQLMRVKGIGAKVADCIDLYGNHNLEAFPIDVHIKNIIDREYGGAFDTNMKWKGVYQMFMFYYELMKGV